MQEEASALGKPLLILRDSTERTEAITAGATKLVGTNTKHIVKQTLQLVHDPEAYKKMAHVTSPYGNGNSAQQAVAAITRYLKKTPQNSSNMLTLDRCSDSPNNIPK